MQTKDGEKCPQCDRWSRLYKTEVGWVCGKCLRKLPVRRTDYRAYGRR